MVRKTATDLIDRVMNGESAIACLERKDPIHDTYKAKVTNKVQRKIIDYLISVDGSASVLELPFNKAVHRDVIDTMLKALERKGVVHRSGNYIELV